MFKKKIPVIPAFIVSDSAAEADDKKSTFNESFVYCPDIKTDQLDTLKKSYRRKTDEQYTHESKYDITLERKSVKDLVHLITSELKRKGVKTPLLILPFRPSHHDEDLKRFLDRIFVKGVPVDEKTATDIIQDTNEYILMSALKFIWCRLPGKAVIGWKAYTEFVKLEENAGFPDKAFLEFMPNCLSSGAHASIVYDFFDLIVAFVLNSKDNLMTATKFSKVCGLWAFNPVRNKVPGSPSFERGLYEWIPASDAMFHLLLAFVKSMPPNGDTTKLPKIFQILLKKTDYPPLPTSATLENSRQLQEIPIVTIRSNNPCKNPAELLTKVNKTLKFDDPTVFYTREDFLLLKRIFKEKDAVAEKLSSESSRILENLCLFDKDLINDGKDSSELKYKLVPGWSTDMTSRHLTDAEKDINDFFTASVGRASIDDYFIWAWLASLGIEETDLKKKTFGKTYIMEVELAEGFKKWVIVEEQDLERDGYDIELEIKQQKLKQLEKQIHLAELEAKKIKKKALLEAERLEIERYEAKKLKDQTLANKLTSSSPPPLPAKDYDNDIPPRSKSRKPPPKSLTTDEYTIPNKSNKRKLVNGSSVEKNNEEIDSFNKLGDIRISLPELDIDDSFLKHDLLEVLDSDFTVDTAARVRGSNDGSPNYDSTTHKNNISNAYRGVPNDASDGSPDRNKQMVTPERQSPPKGYLNYNPNGNNISPARSSSPQRPGLPLGTNHQPYYGSPPRTAYPPGSGSPPRTAYPPRSASPPRTAYPPRSASPPRTAYPPGSGSPPRAAYPPRSGSPPRTAYPPRSASPPRAAYLPQTKPASPSAFYQQTRVPQQISPPQRSDYPNEFASQKRFSLPNMPESSEISAPTIPSSAGPRRPNSQQPETISSSYPQIGSLENETSTNNVYKSQQFPSLRNGIKYHHDNIPILPPPDVASVVESDLLSETSIPFRSPVTKAQLENSFDNLENDFKDCMQNLNDLESQIDNSEKRQVSSSRVRKAPPQSVKQITVSGSSSSYPPTHVTVAQENTESLPLLSTADNSRKSSTQASRQSKSSNTAASNISEGNISIDSRFSPPNGLPVNYPPPSAHSNAMQYPTKSPKPPPMPYGTHQHQTPQYSPSMAFSPPQFPQQHQRPSPKNPRNRLSKVPPMGQYPPGYPPQAGYPQGYFPQGYPPGYPAQPPNMGYPPVYSTPVLNTGYPQGYYQPMPGVPPGMTNNGSGSFPADPTMSPYSNNVINHMPPTGRIDKLHGPQNINKKNARDAFMSGDFGI